LIIAKVLNSVNKLLFLLQLEPRLRELIYIGYNLQLPTKDHENTADVEMVDIDILQDSAFQEDAFQFHVVLYIKGLTISHDLSER
jgi:hypothetical protein